MAVIFAWIAVGAIVITSVGLLLTRDWRWAISLLAVQYLGMFVLVLQHWPLGMASVKVVAGWMSAAILGMTRSGLLILEPAEDTWPRGRPFRLFAAGIVALIVVVVNLLVDVSYGLINPRIRLSRN
jgi:ABC-type microcin C transport system permease subunit YejB